MVHILITTPFQKCKKEELVPELEDHRHFTAGETRAELQEALVQIFHGICRPFTLCYEPLKSASELNIEHYQVLCCEPLRHISKVIQNISKNYQCMYQNIHGKNLKLSQKEK